ncbi:hypothetical protein [Rhodohalobacter sp. SW132]|uniref:hypothetical protein n=1 Tax=Rhodohalobacter sp. SW132 TaxID=2293433 RepID=UPI0018F7BB12|nr:hypothetical protein [Rhodohalobacter sp. SW132]
MNLHAIRNRKNEQDDTTNQTSNNQTHAHHYWALFAGSIVAIPILAWLEMWTIAGILILIVLLECLVLLFNGMRCPLTDIAARYTDDRADNFDIFLPL